MNQKPVDPTVCPICGKSNQCERVKCESVENCWCSQIKFSQKLIDKVPEKAKRKACICRECVERNS